MNLADSIYFHFIQKRSTTDIFKLIFVSDDVPTLIPGFIMDYWFVIVTWLILMVITWLTYPKLKSPKKHNLFVPTNWIQTIGSIAIAIILIGTTIIGARGGLQLKPLSIIDASKHTNASQIPLVLNSAFTIMTTYGHDNLVEKEFFSNDSCEEIYPIIYDFSNPDKDIAKKKYCCSIT